MPSIKRLPEVLTLAECESLLAGPNRKCPTGLRNAAMITLMLKAGLRASEVLNLGLHDVELESGKLTVKNGKGGKDRILWLSEDTRALLRSWKKIRPKGNGLFSTLAGGHIKDRYLRAMVKREARQAGIVKNVHPHTLRHTFATIFYQTTKEICLVQKALGHSDLATTMIYTHIVDDDLEAAMKGFEIPAPRPRGTV